ncbi:MAG: helix-turn-helix domain-containing protein [Chloroflexales bacterium]|nr:helix-turn-helix domain-containing protein [Chloroflexales bacterium]
MQTENIGCGKIFPFFYTRVMGMEAVGTYLATLRRGRRLSQQKISQILGVTDRTLRTWEQGKAVPNLNELALLVVLLEGTWNHIRTLTRQDATGEDGRTLARRQLQGHGLTDEQLALIEGLDDDQLAALLVVAEQMLRQ